MARQRGQHEPGRHAERPDHITANTWRTGTGRDGGHGRKPRVTEVRQRGKRGVLWEITRKLWG